MTLSPFIVRNDNIYEQYMIDCIVDTDGLIVEDVSREMDKATLGEIMNTVSNTYPNLDYLLIMKKLFLFFFLICLPMFSCAFDFENNGIYYTILSGENKVMVTSGEIKYSGKISIPSTVSYSGKTYDVTIIDDYCMSDCNNLESVFIPNSIESIGMYCFSGCTSITYLTIPSSVESIGKYCFNYCTNLESVVIPDKVNQLPEGVFKGCSNLSGINLPIELKEIGNSCFAGCTSIQYVDMPNTILEIGELCFENCKSLSSLHLSDALVSLPSNFLKGCSNLSSILIPNNVKYLSDHCFSTSGIEKITIPQSVQSIGNYCFYGCEKLKSIIIKSSITKLPDYSFYGCTLLNSITLETSISNIGLGCFQSCTSLESFQIPDDVITLSGSTFYGCTALKTITYNSCLTSIGANCFYGCTSLEEMTLPNTITEIGNGCFEKCTSLSIVKLSSSLQALPEVCFAYCEKMESLNIPSSVNSIGGGCFSFCTLLKNITIPSSVQTIGRCCFQYCTSLSSIIIPASVTNIEGGCFNHCSNLTNVEIKGPITSLYKNNRHGNIAKEAEYYGFFEGCTNLSEFIIPSTVTSIGSNCFTDCSSIKEIYIPNTVSAIEDCTFQNCVSLTTVTIPNSVTSISSYRVFYGCSNLNQVISKIVEPFDINENVFSSISSNATLFVPEGTKERYLLKSGWSRYFKTIKEEGTITSYNLSITASGNGAASYDGTIVRDMTSSFTMNDGASATITFTPDNGYRIKSVKVNNTTVSVPNNQYTISNISQDITVEVEFMIDSAANKFEVDGLNYNILSSNTVELTWKGIREPYIGDIVIPDNVSYNGIVYNVVRIGDNAFQNVLSVSESGHARVSAYNSELSSIKFPSTLISIGQHAFSGCSGITSITFPSSLTSIEGGAFSGCSGLTSITIPCALTSIGRINVFYNCSNLTSITVESNNKQYDSRNNCNAIIETSTNRLIIGCKNTVIPNTITSIGGGAFSHCSGLTSLTIPSSVTKIEDTAFLQCFDLTSIIIPNSLTTIGKDAFGECSALTSITIPNSVTSIGNYAFADCSSLTYVKSNIAPPFTIDNDVFSGISSTAKLEVPKGTKNQYQTISGWTKYFKEIVEFDNTITYTLSITASGSGSASYDGTTIRNKTSSFTVNAGSSATITFSPDNGYRIKSVKENNTVVTSYVSNGIYTINSLSRNTTVEVEFEEILQAFSADDVNYTVVSVDEQTIRLAKGSYGITLEVPAKVNYQNTEWTVTGIDNGALSNNPDLAAIIWNPDVVFTEQVSNPNLLLYVNQTQYAPSSIKNVVVNGNANSITLTDAASGNNFHCPQAFTAQKISYIHNYSMKTGIGKAQGWETIALPFDVQKVTHQSKGEIVSFAKWKSGDTKKPFWLMELSSSGWKMAESIEANTPYIISMPNNDEYKAGFLLNGSVTFSAENVTVAKTENLSIANYSDRTFVPTFASLKKSNDVLALNVVNDIERVTGGSTEGSTFERNLRPIHPFEAYMTSTSSTRSIGIDEGMATGIIELITALSDECVLRIYNLNGQLIKIEEGRSLEEVMKNLPAGIYIVNGKKMIVR